MIKPDNPPCPLDDNGKFTNEVKDFAGIYVKDADKLIQDDLKAKGRLIKVGKVKHNYPFCWRSDTPLVYKAVHSWFIKVTDLKEDLIKNNKKSYWVPTYAQEGRFNNWLEDAKDWCFSRSRYQARAATAPRSCLPASPPLPLIPCERLRGQWDSLLLLSFQRWLFAGKAEPGRRSQAVRLLPGVTHPWPRCCVPAML